MELGNMTRKPHKGSKGVKNSATFGAKSNVSKPKAEITCFKCGKPGHIVRVCPSLNDEQKQGN